MMESIEKLRDYANEHIINGPLMNAMIDEIEREIADNYMRLPVASDGMPIRPGDLMACTAFDKNAYDGKEHVFAVAGDYWVDKYNYTHMPSETLHVKPRTLEDVLKDFAIGVCEEDGFSEEHVRCCADEVRQMMKQDTERERTCHLVEDGGLIHCSNCGGAAAKKSWAYWNHCPNCGCKVVS